MSSSGFISPADEALIAEAVAGARQAGVPEAQIERILTEELELTDEFTEVAISGRLAYFTRQRRPEGPASETAFTAHREPDPW